ncbi:MAG: hypothetical protein AB9903_09050 [Vulcanimicrobiota bacterium]
MSGNTFFKLSNFLDVTIASGRNQGAAMPDPAPSSSPLRHHLDTIR